MADVTCESESAYSSGTRSFTLSAFAIYCAECLFTMVVKQLFLIVVYDDKTDH